MAVTGREPVLRGPQLVRVALFLAEQVYGRPTWSSQPVKNEVLFAIRRALPPNVALLPHSVPSLVADNEFVGKHQNTLIGLAARALIRAVNAEPRMKIERIVAEAVEMAVHLVLAEVVTDLSVRRAALQALFQALDELLLSLEIAAVARQDFVERHPRVLFRAAPRRLDVAVVSFTDGYGVLARVGPRRKKRRRYLRWVEGPLDDVLSVIPERYFAAAVQAVMQDQSAMQAA